MFVKHNAPTGSFFQKQVKGQGHQVIITKYEIPMSNKFEVMAKKIKYKNPTAYGSQVLGKVIF